MVKFNPHVNLDVYRWNEDEQRDGEYVGRISADGQDFIPAQWDDEETAKQVKADLKKQYENEDGWSKEEWPEEIVRFIQK